MHRPHLVALLVPALALTFALGACVKDPPDGGADAGTSPGDGGGDAGPVDAGDGKCHGDLDCPLNQYCELASGLCIDAKPCTSDGGDGDCYFQHTADDDYCAYGACFCDLERNGGSCRPRFKPCQACTRDVECGSDAFIFDDYVANCTDYQGEKICLPLKSPRCPAGYVATATAFCEPNGGSCAATSTCSSDAQCDPFSEKPVCDKARGFCVNACLFNYQTGISDCPPEQGCHVVEALLTGDNLNFGNGKCGPPCDGAGAVACSGELTCVADGDPLHAVQPLPRRCRPTPPKCVRDADCPASPDNHSRGFCNRDTLACELGCRRESDCEAGYKCSQNQCVQQTCIEGGGAINACTRGAFCCGEANSFAPCPTGVSQGECYEAPNPPWCGGCETSGAVVPSPGGSTRPLPSYCWKTGDTNLQWHSCDRTISAMCPRGRNCEPFVYFCTTDADCGAGGKCGDVSSGLGDFKACVCNGGESCPSGSACDVKDDQGTAIACGASWCSQRDCLPPP